MSPPPDAEGPLVARLFVAIDRQTESIVTELRASRGEFRVFVAAIMLALVLVAALSGRVAVRGSGAGGTLEAIPAAVAAP